MRDLIDPSAMLKRGLGVTLHERGQRQERRLESVVKSESEEKDAAPTLEAQPGIF
jgi:hypothetical protein